jgi:hypothetical protein
MTTTEHTVNGVVLAAPFLASLTAWQSGVEDGVGDGGGVGSGVRESGALGVADDVGGSDGSAVFACADGTPANVRTPPSRTATATGRTM